ncbi:MAG: nuclear transport factor 2 family protein [Flavobacteriaceae bacterium]
MKKLILLFLCSFFLINCDSNSGEMMEYEKNAATAKKFYQSFSDKKLIEMRSFVTDDYTWSPPPTGVDSLDVDTWSKAMQGFNDAYDDIEFTKQLYFAGLDENQKPNGDVRVYGTWKSLNAVTKKPVEMDYYAVLFFNDEGKIYHQSEWYNSADLDQNSLVDVVALIPLTKGYKIWYKGFMKDRKNRERFCDDSRTLVQRDVNNSNMVSVYLFDVDMSELGKMMADPKFEKLAISLGEDLANKKVYVLKSL